MSPSLAFVLAVTVFEEPFTAASLAGFACIWAGLAVYSVDSVLVLRRRQGKARTSPELEETSDGVAVRAGGGDRDLAGEPVPLD
jgi:hypothetical protein